MRTLKGEREERGHGPSEPPPKGARDSSSAASSAENEPAVSQETCKEYMKEVKVALKDDPESYRKFMELMRDVQHQRKQVDLAGVVSRIKEIFHGYTSLMLRFNIFLPDRHRITLHSTEASEVFMRQQGILILRKVKALGTSKYQGFLEILALHKKHTHSVDDLYKWASRLFADHSDILADFRTFMSSLGDSSSELRMPAQEPDPQADLDPKIQEKLVLTSANVGENEEPGDSSGRDEMARKGKWRRLTSKRLQGECSSTSDPYPVDDSLSLSISAVACT